MTKKEAELILDQFSLDDMSFYDISPTDLMTFVNARVNPKEAGPMIRFLMDHDACLGGQTEWFKYKTCESAIRAAHRNDNRDALEWFTCAVGGCYTDVTVDGSDAYYGELKAVKYFLDLIPKKYRTETEPAKKTAKKATNAKRRNRR